MNKYNSNIHLDKNVVHHGDCLELMNGIPDVSVDMILADLPYGTTSCKWDIIIPFDKLWEQYKRVLKDNGAIVLFGSEPFSTSLRSSNLSMYKYDWIWEKSKAGNFALARKNPMKYHENISVFYKCFPTYNLWRLKKLDKPVKSSRKNKGGNLHHVSDKGGYFQTETGFHNSILRFSHGNGVTSHPTEKPVALLEYLIKTYTNDGEIVLDNVIGSGSTAIACMNTNRNFIGIELNEAYYNISKERVEKHKCIVE